MKSKQISLLGDPHNGGRRTFRQGNSIFKYRPLYGEYLLLSQESFFRKSLEKTFKSPLALPSVFVQKPDYNFTLEPQKMDYVEVYLDEEQINSIDCLKIGQIMAILTWLGAIDLNQDNLLLGKNQNHLVLAPIDLEMLFSSETQFLNENVFFPHRLHKDKNANAWNKIARNMKHPNQEYLINLCRGYQEAFEKLYSESQAFMMAIKKDFESIEDIIIRVTKRDSNDYLNETKIFESYEREQLKRGDIPIFYTRLADPTIYYWDQNCSLEKIPQKKWCTESADWIKNNCHWHNNPEKLFIFFIHGFIENLPLKPRNFSLRINPNLELTVKNSLLLIYWNNRLFKRTLQNDD